MIPESIQSLILSLNRQGIEAIIGGGLAVNAHGFARLPLDADLLVRPSAEGFTPVPKPMIVGRKIGTI